MVHRIHSPLIVLFSTLLFSLISVSVFATHNRAGEITHEQISALTVRATITTYTKASSRPADRDSLEICWGDGFCEWVQRSNGGGNGVILPNDTKVNIYIAEHTYAAQGHFRISMTDPNRNGGILNVNPPSSDNVPFHLETTVTLFNPQFVGFNNSPRLLQPPIDIACVNRVFTHNPNAYDPDGDSLSYELITPLQDVNTPVPNYSFPNQIQPGPGNNINLNPRTGDFVWDSPQREGEYNIAFYIIEYRDGRPIDTLIRDMQILVEDCENLPPEIEVIDEICVIAGERVEFTVTATAPLMESDQRVLIEARGGPLVQDISPASFNVAPGYQPQPLEGTFVWETKCEHISDQFYSVIFRAVDDFPILDNLGDTLFLSTLKLVRIKVVGPPPQDVMAVAETGQVEVTWENPYACEDAMDEYFRGFSVWRREGSNLFPPDTCNPGLAGKGYTRLNNILTREIVNNRYYYLDTEVDRGRTYCYRILAEFARLSPGGNPFNKVESLPSEEVCVQLSRDVPLIINASVRVTDAANGEVYVRWVKPNAEDLDTLLNPGPYRYQLLRTTGQSNSGFMEIPGASFTSTNFADPIQTDFVDTGLDTRGNPYTYQVAFYVNNEVEPLGTSPEAATVFLSIASTDNVNNLSWAELVPWSNYFYTIFRQNTSGTFDSIGISTTPEYSDTDLVNGTEYCYYIRTEGTYGIDSVPSPLINLSQEACGTPLDTIPPCPPVLRVINLCDDVDNQDCSPENLINELDWDNPNNICPETDDVIAFNIYFSPIEGGEFGLVGSITDTPLDTFLVHSPDLGLAGCYAVTAVDSFNNESAFSNIFCVDNCPTYELPNAFTPNQDGANELYVPFTPYCFIDRIEISIVNRWGQLVFESTDPEIRWDGTNLSGDPVAEGVYYYNCRVFENRVTGVAARPDLLSGYIHLIRGKK